MELPAEEERGVTASTPRHDESETESSKSTYADLELEQGQEENVPVPALNNEESEIDSDERVEEISVPLSTSSNEESDTDSGEQDEGRRMPMPIPTSQSEESDADSGEQDQGRRTPMPTPTPRNEESDTDSSESSDDDVEIKPGCISYGEDSSRDSSTEVFDGQTLAEEEDGREGNAHVQEECSGPKASAEEQYEPSSSVDGVVEESMEIGPEIAELNKQVLGDDVGTAFPASEEEIERDENAGLHSGNAPINDESKPSSSQVNVARDIGPETVTFDAQGLDDPTEIEEEYVKKGFTCDGNTEEDDEHLREYWTRALQTSTSTGQVVEEIVKVLKHHQKTHDLLCPVCGSCVTRRVILRKRKRSSLISVDRWYRDPLDEGELQEQGSSLEVTEAVEEEDPQEYQDTKAFGCLSCFSLFIEKGYLLLNQLQADIGSDTFNCLPFFFPPYPWGMTQSKLRSPGVHEDEPSLQETEEAVALNVQESLSADVKSDFACGIGSTLLPDYPWGTIPCSSNGVHEEEPSLQETEEAVALNVQESLSADVKSDFACGIGSTLLPDYPWGTIPCSSNGVHEEEP
eukprot:c21662_g2_i2 orf=206-1930(+)